MGRRRRVYEGKAKVLHRVSASIGESNPMKTYYYYRNRRKYMKRFQRPLNYGLFLLYSFGFMYPAAFIRNLNQPGQLSAIFKSIFSKKWG